MPYWLAVCEEGLEGFLADEVKQIKGRVHWQESGRLVFAANKSLNPENTVANNLGIWLGSVGGFSKGPEGLAELAGLFAGLDLSAPLALVTSKLGLSEKPTFRVTATRSGETSYNSQQIAAALGEVLYEREGWPVDLEHYELEVLAIVEDSVCHLAFLVTPGGINPRLRIAHAPASLNYQVARAMVRAANPQQADVVLDPMCGAGTLLVAAGLACPTAQLAGGDLDPKMLPLARSNLEAQGLTATLAVWKAQVLPLEEASVDIVLSNLPFGRRVGSHTANQKLYPAFFTELARVARPGGQLLLLTTEIALVKETLHKQTGLELHNSWRLKVGGLSPVLFRLKRTLGEEPGHGGT